MGIHEMQTPSHWNYFLALEEDVVRLSRYIEFTQDHFSAYSPSMPKKANPAFEATCAKSPAGASTPR
jgi:hypothetical protein